MRARRGARHLGHGVGVAAVADVEDGHDAGRYVELEGAPDLVVEIVSDSSVAKDTQRLPPRYAAAGRS